MKILTLLFVMALVGPASAADNATVAVMPLRSINVPEYVTEVLDSTLAVAVGDAGNGLRVLSANDINAMLGVERMKDAVGCDDVSCAVDIGGALNAELIVTGNIGKLGDKLTVNLVLVNISETAVEARVQETIRDDENMYQDGVRGATQKLFARRAPPPSELGPNGIEASVAAIEAETAALRDDTQRQRRLLAQLVEAVESSNIPTERKLALVDEFIRALPTSSPVRAEAETMRELMAVGGPRAARTVMFGLYGFGGVARSSDDTFATVGVAVEGGRLRWRNLQVSLARGFVGTSKRMTGAAGSMPVVFGVSLAGIGGKVHVDRRGKLELGMLVFPISIAWQQEQGADGHLNNLGFARTCLYFRYIGARWGIEAGVELSPAWVANRSYLDFGYYGYEGLPATFAYLGFTLPTTVPVP